MEQYSEEEFLSDMRAAVSQGSSDKKRKEAIEWQVGRSLNHDKKILTWVTQLDVSRHLEQPRCQPLVRAVFNSSTSNTEELLRSYVMMQPKCRSGHVRDQLRDVVFGANSLFLNRFKILDTDAKHCLLAEIFSIDPYQSRFPLEICYLAECCDWGALHRLVPSRMSWIGETDVREVAVTWFRVWETYQDICGKNDKGAS